MKSNFYSKIESILLRSGDYQYGAGRDKVLLSNLAFFIFLLTFSHSSFKFEFKSVLNCHFIPNFADVRAIRAFFRAIENADFHQLEGEGIIENNPSFSLRSGICKKSLTQIYSSYSSK